MGFRVEPGAGRCRQKRSDGDFRTAREAIQRSSFRTGRELGLDAHNAWMLPWLRSGLQARAAHSRQARSHARRHPLERFHMEVDRCWGGRAHFAGARLRRLSGYLQG